MPFSFGTRSQQKLASCDLDLVIVAEKAIAVSPVDFAIIHGLRGRDLQDDLFFSGASKKRWPDSNHNHPEWPEVPLTNPPHVSRALDFGVWYNGKVQWGDELAFARVAGVFDAVAESLGIAIEWGGDWDDDGSSTDQSFMDLGHIQLVR